ncbi:hypothetical protein G3576_28390 [Roseomonas stagni]|uniref:Uncharacterized protein n=1 Tax=Falsiroseomonas algicola TaxID=2716930 RepID=A0A6M1LV94_9PROT|nr:hypothetical protein [Falsiroseomonas algicola]NGM23959.1 hypothetical protein [Falsiroseomonas algicola]
MSGQDITSTVPGELEQAVAVARSELAEAIDTGGLRRDPLRFVLAALSSSLVVFPAAVRRVEAASETVRQPLSPKVEAELLRRVEEAARRGAATAGPVIARRTAILAGAALLGAAMLGGVAGWWAGRTSLPGEVAIAEHQIRTSLAAAAAWVPILQANPDPRPALARSQAFRDERTGWRAGTITLYLEPGSPVPTQPRP